MGWLFSNVFSERSDFKQFIADRVKNENMVNFETKEAIGTFTCLKHCVRGNVLWTVWEVKRFDDEYSENVGKYIGCDLLKFSNGWGYKDMEESVGPCYYTCPKSYLEMVPVKNQEWRDQVMAYHNAYTKIKAGDVLVLTNGDKAKIVSKRPLHGIINGTRYRIPRRMISLK